MKWDEQDAIRADERRAIEAHVLDVVDELKETHDGDWPMMNALDVIRLRFVAVFATAGDDDDDDDT